MSFNSLNGPALELLKVLSRTWAVILDIPEIIKGSMASLSCRNFRPAYMAGKSMLGGEENTDEGAACQKKTMP